MSKKLLNTLGTGQGYLRGGLLGFPKSGKTYTGLLLVIATRQMIGSNGPIAMFDTEGGSEYIAKMVKQLTGQDLIGIRSRSFDDMLAAAKECEKDGIGFYFVDSVTHPWRELCDAYLKKVNEARKRKHLSARKRLEFQDWNPIKTTWGAWTEWYLNAPVHNVICGRAGFIYEYQTNEETQRKELMTTGVKMKTETEFGFEPSLLVEMERVSHRGDGRPMGHMATVIGDRFGVIDGCQQEFVAQGSPAKDLEVVMKFFRPHLEALQPGTHATVDTTVKSDLDIDENGHDEVMRWRREKEIFLEEIQGEILRAYPGQTKEEKMAKADLIETVFNTRSWTKISMLPNDILKAGLGTMRKLVSKEIEPPEPAMSDEEANNRNIPDPDASITEEPQSAKP